MKKISPLDSMTQLLNSFWGNKWKSNYSRHDTAHRFVNYLNEFHDPECTDQKIIDFIETGVFVDENANQGGTSWIRQTNIPFRMICEHHLLPAWGYAHIAYLPDGKILGLSKFPRIVDMVGRQNPTLQESINRKILCLLNDILEPAACIVAIQAEHSCMAVRGINALGVITHTEERTEQIEDMQVNILMDLAKRQK